MNVQVDDIWKLLGPWGRYQILTLAYLFIGMITFAFTALGIVFTVGRGFTPPYTCKEISTNTSYLNDKIWNHNITQYEISYDQCHIDFRVNGSNNTDISFSLPCVNGYKYQSEGDTIVTESWVAVSIHLIVFLRWDLVCEDAGRGELTQTLLVFGQLFGAVFFPSFSDRFGRKTVYVFTTLIQFGLLLSISFVKSYIAHAVLRFLIGALLEGFGLTSAIFMLEIFPKQCRGKVSASGAVFWSFSVMFLAPFGYLLRNYSWRYLQITTALTSIYGLFNYYFYDVRFLDESLRWLVANGKTDNAIKVVSRAARWNNVDPEEPVKILLQTEQIMHDEQPRNKEIEHLGDNTARETGAVERYNILTIVRHKIVLKTTNSLTYYGLTLTSSTLAGNRFLNYFLTSVVEFPGAICYLYLIDRKGRKFSSIFFHAIAGVSLIIAVVLLVVGDDTGSLKIVSSVFSLLGKFGISSSFNVIFLFTPEMYPTNLRNVGIGMASTAAKIGGMIAPFSMVLAAKAVWAPGVIFGGLCLLVTVLTTLLPETKGHELPQFIEELKIWYKSQG
ncbi:hypothetical protein KUTeg_017971, partial [Tegillarca granosa]